MELLKQLRADAVSRMEKSIDLHTIVYQQGREIAQTYVNTMKSYARLDVQSGHVIQNTDTMFVRGFCRIEEHHFDHPLLQRERKQNFWTARWEETISLLKQDNDLFDSFLTSMEEFCRKEGIGLGELCALIRTSDGKQEQRKFPVHLTRPAYLEAIGFPYQIAF